MKVSYDRESDILMIQVGDEKIDYAEEMGPIIIHFTEKGKPVLLEILDASEFLSQTAKISIRSKAPNPVEV